MAVISQALEQVFRKGALQIHIGSDRAVAAGVIVAVFPRGQVGIEQERRPHAVGPHHVEILHVVVSHQVEDIILDLKIPLVGLGGLIVPVEVFGGKLARQRFDQADAGLVVVFGHFVLKGPIADQHGGRAQHHAHQDHQGGQLFPQGNSRSFHDRSSLSA